MLTFDKTKKLHEQITPDMWTKGYMFLDSKGYSCFIDNKDVCKGCLIGLLRLYYNYKGNGFGASIHRSYNIPYSKAYYLIGRHGDVEPYGGIGAFNDNINRTFEDVKKVLKELNI